MTRNSILGDSAITSDHQINMTERWRSESHLQCQLQPGQVL